MIIENGFAVTLSMQNTNNHRMGCIMNIDNTESNYEEYLYPNITFLCEDMEAMKILDSKLEQIRIQLRGMIK